MYLMYWSVILYDLQGHIWNVCVYERARVCVSACELKMFLRMK